MTSTNDGPGGQSPITVNKKLQLVAMKTGSKSVTLGTATPQ